MHIAIDARAWDWTGIGRYIRSLVREYSLQDSEHTFTLIVPVSAEIPENILNSSKFTIYRTNASYYSLREQLTFRFELNRINADLYHFPHFNIPIGFSRPYVVTIHDTTRFMYGGQRRRGFQNQMAYELIFSSAVKRAKHVICVSESTRIELKRFLGGRAGGPSAAGATVPPDGGGLGQDPKNVSVIYEGVDEEFSKPIADLDRAKVRALLGIQDPYILYVGVWMNHKNLPRLLEAFTQVKKTHPSLQLVITGKPVPKYTNVLDRVRELQLEKDVVFPGFVPHALLPALYKEAELLAFPSLYEGFGLPALEAAAIGTPVVCSNVTSLPEIMKDAAEYVNPENIDSITNGLKAVIENQSRKNELIVAGKNQALEFSWKTCANDTLVSYREALAS